MGLVSSRMHTQLGIYVDKAWEKRMPTFSRSRTAHLNRLRAYPSLCLSSHLEVDEANHLRGPDEQARTQLDTRGGTHTWRAERRLELANDDR